MSTTPTHCRFEHPGLVALGAGVFRLTKDDKVAALALHIDSADVVVPLHAVARLLGIQADSPDGRMLRLVEQALRFVPQVQLEDELPTEVLTGEASWKPSSLHHKTATAKLHLRLLDWIDGSADTDEGRVKGQLLVESMEDPSIKPRVQEALRRTATRLSIGGGSSAVSALIAELSHELAFIEALREWLLERAKAMLKRLTQTSHDLAAMAPARRETLFQVVRLAATAVAEIATTFEEIDAQTSEIGPALCNLEQHRSVLRVHRDSLYSTMLAWNPLLTAWDGVRKPTAQASDDIWKVVDETYRFLAPRFMAVQQWQSGAGVTKRADRAKAPLVW